VSSGDNSKKNRRQFLLAAVGRPKAVPANSLLLWKESRGPGLVTLNDYYISHSLRVKQKIRSEGKKLR
jgi:hypothetical protein